ncbi:MAG: LUD domain-containing protein, partial [Pseudomonadota bacterium]|nr:LUD domain-containing protein [Pseudomonadota bacterium]
REEIVNEARQVLRRTFLGADVGITGANFLIAETGSTVLVTNEGNGDLGATLPRVHIVTASIEKVIPTLNDLSAFMRLLGRSATGQEMSAYNTLFTGPRRAGEPDGPEAFHIVLLDNGRSDLLQGDFHDMLRCIRCGACLNHCPVYGAIGGHAYGWVYPGPMGSVLTPLMVGPEEALDLPNACTLNGRCGEICPMRIPLPDLLRRHRQLMFRQGLLPPAQRAGLRLWAWLARRPRLYGVLAGAATRAGGWLGRRRGGSLGYVPLAGGWTRVRDLPAPSGKTFQQRWGEGER